MLTSILLSLASFFVVMPLVEYVSHRWFMHRRRGHHVYRQHCVEHHHHQRNESIHIDMHPFQPANGLSALALVAGAWAFSLTAAVVWVVCLGAYCWVWTTIHRASHDLGKANWLTRTRYATAAVKHHLAHHEKPYLNFGTVFYFTDWLFGTSA